MKSFGCLLLLAALGFVALEIWVYISVAIYFDDEYLGLAALIVICSFIGFKLTRWRASKMPGAIMSGKIGEQGVAIFGTILITFPGLLTTVCGILLQIPPVQKAFSGFAAKVVAALVKIAYERMGNKMPGGMGGMPGATGGMGGAGGFQFPGMQADDSVKTKKPKKKGRIIDMKKPEDS